ncbi:LysR family transcriptional regulator [Actinomadura rupiterrae]|uniref:LysR family transcriptional regulator n=1 Tax=Actinomadura rupiterrae TaxID=559627 RepID=UPI0020A55962|nr:LysR family transcriptional regulator [Actinomadura rupiterrae]MCP2342670.1 DNA-binding transcriptional LysR family regulator [Actinomadura rupiterrae]
MELGLLRAFLAVAEYRHYGQAAHALVLTQPTLTKQIQTLERRLGGRLFDRGRHGATLTDLGAALLPEAQELVERAEALELRMARLAAGHTGLLTLGFGLSSLQFAPRAVAAFRRRHPDVNVTLDDLPSQGQLDRLERGELDVGFVRMPVEARWGRHILHTDRLAVACTGETPPDDPRHLADWIAHRGLIRLVRSRGPGLFQQITRLCAALGLDPSPAQESRDLQTVLALVAAGAGVAFVPASAADIAPPAVTLVPVAHLAAEWRIGAVWHPGRLRPLTANFLDVVRELHPSPLT